MKYLEEVEKLRQTISDRTDREIGWISVDQCIPKPGIDVLVYVSYADKMNVVRKIKAINLGTDITHWRHLPDRPK